jgi:hypothetical protein
MEDGAFHQPIAKFDDLGLAAHGYRQPAPAGEACCGMLTGWKYGAQKVAREFASSCCAVQTDNEHGAGLAMEVQANIARSLLVGLEVQESISSSCLVLKKVERESICSKGGPVPAEGQEDYLFA